LNATQLTPALPKPALFIPERIAERARFRSVQDPATDCLISTYSAGSHGYAQIGWVEDGERIVTLAHRVIWASVHGPIPTDMTVDHMCKTRKCVNVEHLRLLSNFENGRRANRDWPLGECANGHSNDHLKVFWDGRRHCEICAREWQRKYNAAAFPSRTPRVRTPRPPKPPRGPKTHCRNGHEWIPENFYTRPNGRNECLPCKTAHAKVWHAADLAA
jgi:hypothetical protein